MFNSIMLSIILFVYFRAAKLKRRYDAHQKDVSMREADLSSQFLLSQAETGF